DGLRWAIRAQNITASAVTAVTLADSPATIPPGLSSSWFSVVPGSVSTTRGTILRGNEPPVTPPYNEEILVDVGTISAGGEVVVRFDSVVLPNLTGRICNQALLTYTGGSTVSNDPDNADPLDPTCLGPIGGGNFVVATLRDALAQDLDGDGQADPGDRLLYTARVVNTNPTALSAVVFDLTPGNGASLIAGTVTTTRGVVLLGNTTGANAVRVALQTMTSGAEGVITFEARVASPFLPPPTVHVEQQGSVTAAGLGATLTDDPDTPAQQDATRTPIDFDPDLALTATDDNALGVPGQLIPYRLTFQNLADRSQANGVRLRASVPANTTFDAAGSAPGWSCAGTTCELVLGTVAPLANGVRIFAVRVRNPLPAGVTQFDLTAEVTSDGTAGPDTNPANNNASESTPVDRSQTGPDLAVTKTDGGISATTNDTVVYTIATTNLGNQGATGVRLTETVPTHTTFSPSSSSPGWSCSGSTCQFDLGGLPGGGAQANAVRFAVRLPATFPPSIDRVTNTVSVADDGANGQDRNPANNTATDDTPLINVAPDLRLTKAFLPGSSNPVPGGLLVWELRYSNQGNQDAAGVVLLESAPNLTTFEAPASSPDWQCAGSDCQLALGIVAAGANGVRRFAVRITSDLPPGAEQIENCADLSTSASRGTSPPACSSVAVNAGPDLRITKTDGGVTTTAGRVVVYSIAYSNAGNQGAAGVVLTETVPTHASFEPAESTPGWLCRGGPSGTSCTFSIGSLPAGDSGLVAFAVRVASPFPSGVREIRNQVGIEDDGTSGPDPTPADNTATDTTPVTPAGPGPQPALSALKTDSLNLDLDDDGAVDAGDTVVYLVTLRNTGNAAANGVVFTSPVPEGAVLVADQVLTPIGTVLSGQHPDDTEVTIEIPSIAAGESIDLTFEVEVFDPIPEGLDELVCQGTLLASNHRPVPTDDPETPLRDDPTRTPLDRDPIGPPPAEIPTVGQWGLLLLGVLLGFLGFRKI
ncbi:MAG: IPTL-CTERM sorting domain-containing protein, partial [Thermoanaerobaculia bacterium]|nr:IPTL-CTERM sorting domain-containing protein [Thermoanaerobaculia bacterium]